MRKTKWVSSLQDEGRELTVDEAADVQQKPTKRFSKKIRFAGRLYPHLYSLAEVVYITFQLDSKGGKWFTNLVKGKSDGVHKIGKWIAENRTRVARADIHSHESDELNAMLGEDEYKDKGVLYYLPQREMISHFFSLWGTNFDDLLKPTIDDKLRLLGIMLTQDEVRDYIPDLLGKRRGEKGWQPIDAASSRSLAAWALVLERFLDDEVVIELPKKWSHEDFMKKINERAGVEEFYEKNGTFNPNNTDRLKLPWTEKLLQSMLKDSRTEYQVMMTKYTMGTGGGSGAPENFADWQERDESYILSYTPQQAANLYLTIVFMWDKTHGFPLKPSVGPMRGGREDEQYDGGDHSNDPPPDSGKSTNSGKSTKGDNQLVAAVKDMTDQREISTNKILEFIDGKYDTGEKTSTRSDKRHILVQRIMETLDAIKEWKKELEDNKKKRKKCEDKYANNEKRQKKRLKPLITEMKAHQSTIATLNTTMKQYQKELNDLNDEDLPNKELQYGSSSSSSSSDESDDSDSSSQNGELAS